MLPEAEKIDFTPIEIPKVRRSPWGFVKIAAVLLLIGGGVAASRMGYLPSLTGRPAASLLRFVDVDRGDIDIAVVETGTIESANNTTIRCQVEALLGQVGGAQGAAGKTGGTGGAAGQGGGAAGGGAGGASGATPAATGKAKTAKKAGSSAAAKTGTTAAAGASSSSSGGAAATSGSSSAGASGGAASTASTASTGTTSTTAKPVIRSFAMAVIPHVPLRPVTPNKAATDAAEKQKKAQQQAQGGGGGGRGGGGGGRGGGGGGRGRGRMPSMEDERPGSTTIVWIIPEGTPVKKGQVLCELDSSAFQDEEQAQQIRFLQAKSYVEQANSILEVNKISLREYRDGIYPQDLQLVRHYLETCQLERDRLDKAAVWSREMQKKSYRTTLQVRGDELALQRAEIALGEAQNMLDRLVKQTGPKLLKALEANVKAIESDKFTQDASFNLESQRLDRIRKNVKNCTLVAPADGIVVYANQSNQWGMVTATIDEGVTVRQDQPIINLPDPLHMRVKARINESKLALVRTGQSARIVIDAFPEQPLKGRVGAVTAINTPLNASDVRVYYANVDIADGFKELRPGLSAEVVFLVDSRTNVTRIPLDSIRWVHEHGYVALENRSGTDSDKTSWRWKEIHVGLSDLRYAEVLSGLEPGDRVVASPRDLPAPILPAAPPTSVADLSR